MGKGDRRSRRGKIYNGSHGVRRPGWAKKTDDAGQSGASPARGGRGR